MKRENNWKNFENKLDLRKYRQKKRFRITSSSCRFSEDQSHSKFNAQPKIL